MIVVAWCLPLIGMAIGAVCAYLAERASLQRACRIFDEAAEDLRRAQESVARRSRALDRAAAAAE